MRACIICGLDTGSEALQLCDAHLDLAELAGAVWRGDVTDWPAWSAVMAHHNIMCESVERGSWVADVAAILTRKRGNA